jgi:lipid-A-disaccharide synthase
VFFVTKNQPLRIYIVTGEESGDALGANILSSLQRQNIKWELGGLAGPKMQALGAKSLFNISQLSVMGITAVIAKLPKMFSLIRQVTKDVAAFEPDILLLIDSPDFNYAVAKRVKKRFPNMLIVKYICPSVWAWRQGRAKKMNAFIDHILAILPFEPKLMRELGGPETTYVGHPLSGDMEQFGNKNRSVPANPLNLLVLPGSRKGEVKRLLPVIRDTLVVMKQRNIEFKAVLPAVDHLADYICEEVSHWPIKPEVVLGKKAKQLAFEDGDVALACSGTVLLELGLFSIPTVSIYKLDALGFIVKYMVDAWTACLPNLIVDRAIVPERFEEHGHPQALARELEQLGKKGHQRDAQLEGFKLLKEIMCEDSTKQDPATSKILELAGWEK